MARVDADALLRPGSARALSALVQGRRSLSDLAGALGISKPSLLATLRRLEEAGWIRREEIRGDRGREVFFSLLPASLHIELRPDAGCIISWLSAGPIDPTFPLTSAILDVAVREEVLTALRSMKRRMTRGFGQFGIVLFGSAARGQMTWKSDIDLAFIHEAAIEEDVLQALYDAAADTQELLSHPIRIHPISRPVFLAGKATMPREIASEGIVLQAKREDPLWSMMARHRAISI